MGRKEPLEGGAGYDENMGGDAARLGCAERCAAVTVTVAAGRQ